MAKTKKPQQDRFTYLTTTPVPKLITTLAIPTIISMLVTGIYNTADTYFVGRISTQATAAVGLVFSVMSIIQAVGFFCGHGSGNYIARLLGAGKTKEANEAAATGFAMAAIIGVIFTTLGIIFIAPISRLIGATPTTIADTEAYMRIIMIGAPIMMCQFVVNNHLRFQGSAIYAMAGLLCGAIINIFLDPLLIFVFKMGVVGAAVATVAGQCISFCVLLIGSRRGENIRYHFSNIRLNGHYILQIVNGGAPSLFRQVLTSLSAILLNTAAGSFGGDAAIAGMSVVTRIAMLVASMIIGFGQGYQPVCSFNYGAGLKTRVKEGYYFCIKWGAVWLTAAGIICFAFAPSIIGWFRDDPEVIKVGALALRCQAVAMPLMSFNFIGNMMLQSMGKGVKGSITSSARNGIFFIPLILILPRFLGLLGVEISQAIADVLAVAMTVPMAQSELRKMDRDAEPA